MLKKRAREMLAEAMAEVETLSVDEARRRRIDRFTINRQWCEGALKLLQSTARIRRGRQQRRHLTALVFVERVQQIADEILFDFTHHLSAL